MEGILLLHEDSIAVRYFNHGEVVYKKLETGQAIEIFQNGFWHKVKIHSTTEEPYLKDWSYGDCLGCEVKIS